MLQIYHVEKSGEHYNVVDACGRFVCSADTLAEANMDIVAMLGKDCYDAGRMRDSS